MLVFSFDPSRGTPVVKWGSKWPKLIYNTIKYELCILTHFLTSLTHPPKLTQNGRKWHKNHLKLDKITVFYHIFWCACVLGREDWWWCQSFDISRFWPLLWRHWTQFCPQASKIRLNHNKIRMVRHPWNLWKPLKTPWKTNAPEKPWKSLKKCCHPWNIKYPWKPLKNLNFEN